MKTKSRASSLRKNQSGPRKSTPCANGKCQPPRKSVIASPEGVIMFTYSAIWKRPQRMPEYSVWSPATSSVSASGRSNGARFVSAIPPMKKIKKPTICGPTYQTECDWLSTILTSESVPAVITTPSTDSASETSYETSCAQGRIDPTGEDCDSEAQPPAMKP